MSINKIHKTIEIWWVNNISKNTLLFKNYLLFPSKVTSIQKILWIFLFSFHEINWFSKFEILLFWIYTIKLVNSCSVLALYFIYTIIMSTWQPLMSEAPEIHGRIFAQSPLIPKCIIRRPLVALLSSLLFNASKHSDLLQLWRHNLQFFIWSSE